MPRHWINESEGLAEIRPPRDTDRVDDYQIHPGLLDCGFQLLGAALARGRRRNRRLRADGRRSAPGVRSSAGAGLVPGVALRSLDRKLAVGDVQLMDGSGRVLAKLEGVRLRRVPRDWLARRLAGPLPDWCYELAWPPQPLDPAVADPTRRSRTHG